jgi:predicted PurR-regulated permease PerM
MSIFDRRTASILWTILLFGLALALVYVARTVIIIFCFAILFAYLIDPVVRFIQRHSLLFKRLRGPHVAEAYLALLIFIALIFHVLAPGFLGRSAKLLQRLPTLSDRLATGEIAADLGNKYGWDENQILRLKTSLVQHHSDIQNMTVAAERLATTGIGAVVVIPILAIFFLSAGESLANQVIQLVSNKENYEEFQSLAAELNTMLRHYIRAKVTLGALSLAYVSIASLTLRFPHPLALGVLAGTLEFLPIAGWMIAATTIVSLGALIHAHWICMAVFLGVWRMLMDYWIAPRVMGHELEIHPLLAIFTLMAGAAVGGFVGVYLALPVVAALRVVWRRFATHTRDLAVDAVGCEPFSG